LAIGVLSASVYAEETENLNRIGDKKISFADKLNDQLALQQQQEIIKLKEAETFKANEESCKQFFYADGNMKTQFEVTASYVISNFIEGLFNGYLDVVAIQDEIAKTYALTLSGTPAIEKLNEHFLNKIKDQSKQNYRTLIEKIEIISADELKYKAFITVQAGEASVMVNRNQQNKLKEKKYEVILNLVKAPTFTKKSTIVVKDGIITPKKEWNYNPFELWVKDYSINEVK
ncbi:MAG: hypothetical protein SPL03_06005, partial [Succinivibrio dextrinosolvens]|nr:hypothetical protein [Succinivibrio dextrinosolvens]